MFQNVSKYFQSHKKIHNSKVVIWEVWGGENLLRETGRNELCNQKTFCSLLHLNSKGWLCQKPEGSSDMYVYICANMFQQIKGLSPEFLARIPER